MADNYLNNTGLAYYHSRAKTLFTSKTDFDALEDRVDAIVVPTQTSDLTNDGDGTDSNSPFATQAYVAANGGKIDTIKVNGTAQTITNKAVDIAVPTATSDLANDSDFQTSADVDGAIEDALADIVSISYEVVSELPQTGEVGVIYLVPKQGGSGTNVKDEYIWTGSAFEKIGDTEVDLSGYWAKTELVAITTAQIDTIVAA